MTHELNEQTMELFTDLQNGNVQNVREFFRTADKRTALLTLLEVLEVASELDEDNALEAVLDAMRNLKLQVNAAL